MPSHPYTEDCDKEQRQGKWQTAEPATVYAGRCVAVGCSEPVFCPACHERACPENEGACPACRERAYPEN